MKKASNAGILIIGNEILSGRTQDTNSNYLAKRLVKLGIILEEIRVVPDNKSDIISSLNIMRKKYSYLFTSGGIGPTHDDITADCVAEAFSVELPINQKAKEILELYYSSGEHTLNEARLRMARIPKGASLIENPISKAPGFKMGNVFVLAGVPKIFKAMVKNVLLNLKSGSPFISRTVTLLKAEGDIAESLEKIVREFKGGSVGSYPFEENGIIGTNVVITHQDPALVETICQKIRLLDL